MARVPALQALMFGTGFLLCLSGASDGADTGKLAARGKAILQEKCGRCHAVEAVGESPLKIAPPMRDIYARFAPRELQEELLEGKVSRHKGDAANRIFPGGRGCDPCVSLCSRGRQIRS